MGRAPYAGRHNLGLPRTSWGDVPAAALLDFVHWVSFRGQGFLPLRPQSRISVDISSHRNVSCEPRNTPLYMFLLWLKDLYLLTWQVSFSGQRGSQSVPASGSWDPLWERKGRGPFGVISAFLPPPARRSRLCSSGGGFYTGSSFRSSSCLPRVFHQGLRVGAGTSIQIQPFFHEALYTLFFFFFQVVSNLHFRKTPCAFCFEGAPGNFPPLCRLTVLETLLPTLGPPPLPLPPGVGKCPSPTASLCCRGTSCPTLL